jgi:hypothetical protein
MTILEKMRARLEELRAASAALRAQRMALLDLASGQRRGFTAAELASYDALTAKHTANEEDVVAARDRVAELTLAETGSSGFGVHEVGPVRPR